MLRLKFDLRGKPSVLLTNCKRYYSGLGGLALYRNPPPDAMQLDKLKEVLDDTERKFQDAVNFDRVKIALRDKAIAKLIELFKKVAAFLQLVATENDIPQLLQAGVTVVRPRWKSRKSPSPATT